MREVVALVIEGIRLRRFLPNRSVRQRIDATFVLPDRGGRSELIDGCFSMLRTLPAHDYSNELIDIIKANASIEEISSAWMNEVHATKGESRTRWMEYGQALGSLALLSMSEIEIIMRDDESNPRRLSLLFRARQFDYCQELDKREAIIECILSRTVRIPSLWRAPAYLAQFGAALAHSRYLAAFDTPQPVPLSELPPSVSYYSMYDEEQVISLKEDDTVRKCLEVVAVARQEMARTAKEWATKLSPWDNLVECSRSNWGEQRVHAFLANVAVWVKSREQCNDCSSLLDHSKSLCRRVRHAKVRQYDIAWWSSQFAKANPGYERTLVCLTAFNCASEAVLIELQSKIGHLLDSLSTEEWYQLANDLYELGRSLDFSQRKWPLSDGCINGLQTPISERLIAFLAFRGTFSLRLDLYLRYLSDYQGEDAIILNSCYEGALLAVQDDENQWQQVITFASRVYARTESDIVPTNAPSPMPLRYFDISDMPFAVAREIAGKPEHYPRHLVSAAETVCREHIAARVEPVGQVAQREMWFAE